MPSQHSIPSSLFEYQREDVDRILDSPGNWLVLSEMGTGKTPEALSVSLLGGFKRTLIVCPNTLKLEWARQIDEWLDMKYGISKQNIYIRLKDLFNSAIGKEELPFFIVNYETFRSKMQRDVLNLYPFDLIILDEAHHIRNPHTQQARGMFEFLLEHHADSKLLLLTGSPIVNNPADLHTLLCLCKPEEFKTKSRMVFIDKYCYYYHSRFGLQIYGVRDLEGLRKRTDPYTVRRTKKEVLKYLPEKYYRNVILDMEDAQRKAYDEMESGLMTMLANGEPLWAPSVLSQLTRLRQINLDPHILGIDASSSKTEFLDDLVDSTNEKLVVFSCFEKYIDLLHQRYSKIPHIVITGVVPVSERASAVKLFQNDDSVRLALGTIQCMGEGITLTAASNIVLVDRWWNPAVNNQAIDRLHRIGQKNAVQVILPVNDKSIDKSLDRILAKKATMSEAYLQDKNILREVVDDLRESRR